MELWIISQRQKKNPLFYRRLFLYLLFCHKPLLMLCIPVINSVLTQDYVLCSLNTQMSPSIKLSITSGRFVFYDYIIIIFPFSFVITFFLQNVFLFAQCLYTVLSITARQFLDFPPPSQFMLTKVTNSGAANFTLCKKLCCHE